MPIFETIPSQGVPVKLSADEVDPGARQQLTDLAESGIAEEFVAATPDVHFGLGATIGTVFASAWAVCPNAVGVDIGCSMAAEALSQDRRWELHRTIKEAKWNRLERKAAMGQGFQQEVKMCNALSGVISFIRAGKSDREMKSPQKRAPPAGP